MAWLALSSSQTAPTVTSPDVSDYPEIEKLAELSSLIISNSNNGTVRALSTGHLMLRLDTPLGGDNTPVISRDNKRKVQVSV